ncbi:hypothetical protein BD769DRAFT_1385071 [Suillus cothurnatus]|nr:hypothetical protein BD769DRAFT_1385071 [Suillus cothurnatus]
MGHKDQRDDLKEKGTNRAAQHVIDLAAKERERVALSHEVERWRTFVKVLEVERDDVKYVVEDLIQKVQIMMFSDCSVETKRRKYNIQTNSLGTFLHPVTQAAGILGVRCFGRCHN